MFRVLLIRSSPFQDLLNLADHSGRVCTGDSSLRIELAVSIQLHDLQGNGRLNGSRVQDIDLVNYP
ncbi:hypothetical protein QW71_08565 [Paenibacillus sp. IHB B 3415]|nr:hypothetical protein QW71_08565 [Paenibacillus sp. IHB B 3415]